MVFYGALSAFLNCKVKAEIRFEVPPQLMHHESPMGQ